MVKDNTFESFVQKAQERQRQKAIDYTSKMKLIKDVCVQECTRLHEEYDVQLSFDHYYDVTRTVFMREANDSNKLANREMLQNLQTTVKNIDSDILIGLIINQAKRM